MSVRHKNGRSEKIRSCSSGGDAGVDWNTASRAPPRVQNSETLGNDPARCDR